MDVKREKKNSNINKKNKRITEEGEKSHRII